MRNLFSFIAIILCFAFFGSCEKENLNDSEDQNSNSSSNYSGPDLTTNIVGDYFDDVIFTSNGSAQRIEGYKISVQKISGNRVRIVPSDPAHVTFEAEVYRTDPNGLFELYERVDEEHPKAITGFSIAQRANGLYVLRYRLIKGYMDLGMTDVVSDDQDAIFRSMHYEQMLDLKRYVD
jgi:hypothetical protein